MSVEVKNESGAAATTGEAGGETFGAPPLRRITPGASQSTAQAMGRSRTQRELPTLRQIIDRVKDENPLLDELRKAGVEMRRKGTGYLVGNCPFPNHSDRSPSFKVKLSNREYYNCFGCGAHGDVLDFIRFFYGKQTLKDQVLFLTGKSLRDYSQGATEEELAAAARLREQKKLELEAKMQAEEAARRAAPDEICVEVYEALIDRLELEPRHHDEVRRRGMEPETAFALGYRSLPVSRDRRLAICEELVTEGFSLKRVPGFFRLPRDGKHENEEGNRWCVGGTKWGWRDIGDEDAGLYEVGGMLVPTCDEDGRIIRLKLRNDDPPEDLPPSVREAWPEKYMAMSSTWRPGGASSSVRLHFVGPRDGGRFADAGWLTEGEIKADISALYLHARFIGLPGLTALHEEAMAAIRRAGFPRVLIAMDSENKLNVHLANRQLACWAERYGLQPEIVVWDAAEGKGIDNLVAGGGRFEIVPAATWWSWLGGEEREYVEARMRGAHAVEPGNRGSGGQSSSEETNG